MFDKISSWDNLYLAWRRAARGKRGKGPAAAFEVNLKKCVPSQTLKQAGIIVPSFKIHALICHMKPGIVRLRLCPRSYCRGISCSANE
jgi:hypothetical protein